MEVEDNERMCRVGPGTDMGEAVRRYWIPACLSDQVEAGGSPVSTRLLGEDLVVFRSPDGALGVLDGFCPHRGVSLSLARNEDCGLRCLFHGWKIASDGRLLDAPNVASQTFVERFRTRSYPAVEAAGIVWTYLGPPDLQPERPTFEWETVGDEHVLALVADIDCNWVQSLEGLVDSSHAGVLHTDTVRNIRASLPFASDAGALGGTAVPRLEIDETAYGFVYAALRGAEGSEAGVHARITAYALPWVCFIPPAGQAFVPVPMDDTHTRLYNIWWNPSEQLTKGPAYEERLRTWGLSAAVLERYGMGPVDWSMPDAQRAPHNRFVQDREAMGRGDTFSGLVGVTAEDAALAVSMGPLADRQREHLVPADAAVIRLRRLLIEQADRVRDGVSPLGCSLGTDALSIRAASGEARPGAWQSLLESTPSTAGH